MTSFRAIRIDKDESGSRAAYVDFDEAELMDGDVERSRSLIDDQLQRRPRDYGKSPVRRFPTIPGRRFCRTRDALHA